LTDLDSKEIYEQTDGLELIFVELKKFKKELPEIHSALERWITFLNKAHEYSKENLPKELATQEIQKAMEELEIMYFNEKEQEHFESQQLRMLDEESIARQKAREKEQEERLKKEEELRLQNAKNVAFSEGIAEGIEKVAKQMKLKGKSIDEISDFTGLSKDQIDML